MNLTYKGFSGTRVILTLICLFAAILMYIFGDATSKDVLDFMFEILAAYGLSEVGAKSATAYKEKGESNAQ